MSKLIQGLCSPSIQQYTRRKWGINFKLTRIVFSVIIKLQASKPVLTKKGTTAGNFKYDKFPSFSSRTQKEIKLE
uniref:Uncharacterized protein n=1 Tax=Rhizophora mucronata TaxID=61149 RepID=A0A2P2NMK8_RHIMU